MRSNPLPMNRYERVSQLCGLLAALIGVAALVGWFTGSVALRGLRPSYIPMAPNTAMIFILAGTVLIVRTHESRKTLVAGRILILPAIGLVTVRLVEYLTSIDLQVDHWVFSFPAEQMGLAPVGKMAFFTAATFLLLYVAIFLITWFRRRWLNDAAKVLAGMVMLVGTVFALGYVYGAPLMYGGRSIPMALNTAVAFVFCAAGVLVRASAVDIVARRRADAALRESEERYRLLFENNPLPIWVFDTETLAFLAVNHAAVLHYGYTPEEFLSMTLEDMRPSADFPTLLDHMADIATATTCATWKHRKKDGSPIDVEVTSHSLTFGGKNARVLLAHDVTDRKRAEAAINDLNKNLEDHSALLEQANRELEAFSYSVSHDLRAPLRAIDGFSQILLEDHANELGADGARILDVIRTNTQNMRNLIEDLLAFSRLGRKQIEKGPVDMNTLARIVAGEMDTADSAHAPRFEFEPLPPAEGDAALLRQVFVNLLSNAAKYSKKNVSGCVRVGSYGQNGEHVYYIRDDGVGFDMQYAEKLFGVFQRLHSAEEFEGTGVGLAIVQRIIHRHGGRVWAEGKVNEGATFYFTLPIANDTIGNLTDTNAACLGSGGLEPLSARLA